MSEKIKALYDPSTGKVGCVLLQAGFGGDRRVCQMIDEWEVGIAPNLRMYEAPREEWEALAKMTIEQRIALHFGNCQVRPGV